MGTKHYRVNFFLSSVESDKKFLLISMTLNQLFKHLPILGLDVGFCRDRLIWVVLLIEKPFIHGLTAYPDITTSNHY